jgi:DNA-binding transcriptional MerR regulator
MILAPPRVTRATMEKSPEAYRTISEVADSLDLPQHVLRFWETRFPQVQPLKRAGGRRYYRPDDIERLRVIRRLLYDEGYTIKGVQKLFKQQGVRALSGGAALEGGPPEQSANGGAVRAGSTDGAGISGPEPRLSDEDLAALREALAAIADAGRILAQARSPRS